MIINRIIKKTTTQTFDHELIIKILPNNNLQYNSKQNYKRNSMTDSQGHRGSGYHAGVSRSPDGSNGGSRRKEGRKELAERGVGPMGRTGLGGEDLTLPIYEYSCCVTEVERNAFHYKRNFSSSSSASSSKVPDRICHGRKTTLAFPLTNTISPRMIEKECPSITLPRAFVVLAGMGRKCSTGAN